MRTSASRRARAGGRRSQAGSSRLWAAVLGGWRVEVGLYEYAPPAPGLGPIIDAVARPVPPAVGFTCPQALTHNIDASVAHASPTRRRTRDSGPRADTRRQGSG